MDRTPRPKRRPGALIGVAAFVIIVAGMKAAEVILVPFLVAAFIALICGPPMFWMQTKGVPSAVALLIVVAAILGVGVGIAALVGSSLNDFTVAMPDYQERLREQTQALLAWTDEMGLTVPGEILRDFIDPGQVMQLIGRVVTGLGGLLTNGLLIALTVIFILLEASTFPVKLRAAFGESNVNFARFDEVARNINRYLAIKTAVSVATGLLVTLWLVVLGIDFPVLWGVLAFLLNYVPNIGSIIAAVPAVLVGMIQYGLATAGLVAAGYGVVNVIMGNLVEPKFMGRGLGLSTLVVFLSLVFWGWVFGPVGMLLSVPLTMTVKIALETREDTRWIAILLGSEALLTTAASPLVAPSPQEELPAKSVTKPHGIS